MVEDVLLEKVYEEGGIEQRGKGRKSCRVGRKLWGFGPGYFSGGLEGGEQRKLVHRLTPFSPGVPALTTRTLCGMATESGEEEGKVKYEKGHVDYVDSRRSRETQADLRITFEARPTNEVVLRPVDGPVQEFVLLQAQLDTRQAKSPFKWAEYR